MCVCVALNVTFLYELVHEMVEEYVLVVCITNLFFVQMGQEVRLSNEVILRLVKNWVKSVEAKERHG